MASFIKTLRIVVGFLCYLATICTLTLTISAMAGGLFYGLLEAAGAQTKIANAASLLLFPLVGITVTRFAIRDFRRRATAL